MSENRTVAVFGATGAQGGGLANAILDDPDQAFALRAVTRNPGSDAAKALAERGAEVVQADIDDPSTLHAAMDGVAAVFCLTNFWEHFSGDKERQQATALAEAANASDASHILWSTFSDTRQWLPLEDDRMPVLQERYNIPHFDAKGEADAAFDHDRTTFLLTSFYWDNLIHFGMGPQRTEDGGLAIVMPMGEAPLPGIAAADIGACALGVLKAGDAHRGARVGLAGEAPTGEEMAAALSDHLGQEIRYQAVPADVFRSFGFDGADEMGNMFQFKRDFSEVYTGERDIALARRLHPGLKDFSAWLDAKAAEIPIP